MERTRDYRQHAAAIGIAAAVGIVAASLAGDAKLGFSAPNNRTTKPVTVEIRYPDGSVYPITVNIDPNDNAFDKRRKVANAIENHNRPKWRVVRDPNEPVLTIKDLPRGAVVEFKVNETGEPNDSITVASVFSSSIGFQGVFDPFDGNHLPAVFTAGIVTDVGVLSAQVSAIELDFQTAGPIICQALFQRLAPQAPLYGAQINYAGDRLEIYFDPAYTASAGGAIFGTTSLSPGCSGSVIIPTSPDCNNNGVPDDEDIANGISLDCNHNFVPDECDIALGDSADANGNGVPDECELSPGDMNCDGEVTFADIDRFVQALAGEEAWTDPTCPWLNGDCNGDGDVTFADIDAFVALIGAKSF